VVNINFKELLDGKKKQPKKEIKPKSKKVSSRVLVISDTHIPFEHKDYLAFCKSMYQKFKCNTVVHIGDEVDNHAINYHEKDPDGLGAGKESNLAQRRLKKWYAAFPEVKVCIGNHTSLPSRKFRTAGLPKRFVKTYKEAWNAPEGWDWEFEWEIDGVLYQHGTGTGGKFPHVNRAMNNRQSTVMGHIHSVGGAQYIVGRRDKIFGMAVGCGVDRKSYAMWYGKDFVRKPILGCGIVIGGIYAFFVPMSL